MSWIQSDLSRETSAVNSAGEAVGYLFSSQGTQHINYRGVDDHIRQLWWDSTGWHTDDITAAARAPVALSDPRGYVFAAQGTQHVNYVGMTITSTSCGGTRPAGTTTT